MENTCTMPGTQHLINVRYYQAYFKWVMKMTPYLRGIEKDCDPCFPSLGEMAGLSLRQGK